MGNTLARGLVSSLDQVVFGPIRYSGFGARVLMLTTHSSPTTSIFSLPPGLLAAFMGPGTRSVHPCVRSTQEKSASGASRIFLEFNMTGSRFLRQFCTFVALMLKTAGHEK